MRYTKGLGHLRPLRALELGSGLPGGIGSDLATRQPVGELEKILENDERIHSRPVLLRQDLERLGDPACHDMAIECERPAPVSESEHGPHIVLGHRSATLGDGLIEDGKTVAHRTVSGAGDERQRLIARRCLLPGGDVAEVPGEFPCIHPAQVKSLATRQDGRRNLAQLGRREHELQVLRRLLQGLQQRVERRSGQHVDLVHDVDLVAADRRPVAGRIKQASHVVDARVTRGIDLEDIDVAIVGDGNAVFADAAGLGRHIA